jgi:hypothetical protein
MVTGKTNNDVSKGKDKVSNSSNSSSSRMPDEQDEKKVKDLNREIMMIFQMYKASFGHTSAALLSVLLYLSDNYLRQHPEDKQILFDYFEKEFDKFMNTIRRNKP